MEMGLSFWGIVAVVAVFGFTAFMTFLAMLFRRVVPTNEVHAVQSSRATTSYGTLKGVEGAQVNGNTYYEIPSWVPIFGVTKIVLPISVFDLDLLSYEAYDKGRLPFMVDVKAFFRIKDSNQAAQSVKSFDELKEQLVAIVQGAVRTILASHELEEIMSGRSTFGKQFTEEVSEHLSSWGVETVRNIELMDLRDSKDSKVIHNIMAKKKSFIEMESRTAVAENHQKAEIAVQESQRMIDLNKQEVAQVVGVRTTEAERTVALAQEKKTQAVKEEQKITKEREMEVRKVEALKQAEIEKDTQVIHAEQEKQTVTLRAEGDLKAKELAAQGIKAEGEAKAAAETAMQLAPVEAQIKLSKEIGSNDGYQKYLIGLEQVKATKEVGIEQAKALQDANIKVIATAGSATEGVNNIGQLLTAQGGSKLGAMFESFAQTDVGRELLKTAGVNLKEEIRPAVQDKH